MDTPASNPDELFTVAEICETFGWKPSRIYHWIERGDLRWDISTGRRRLNARLVWAQHLASIANDTGRTRLDRPAA